MLEGSFYLLQQDRDCATEKNHVGPDKPRSDILHALLDGLQGVEQALSWFTERDIRYLCQTILRHVKQLEKAGLAVDTLEAYRDEKYDLISYSGMATLSIF